MYRRLGPLMTHLRLALRMGRTTGTDLQAAYKDGALPQEDWAEMVQSCRACSWGERCPEWLSSHEHVDDAPETCPNRARFSELKAKYPLKED